MKRKGLLMTALAGAMLLTLSSCENRSGAELNNGTGALAFRPFVDRSVRAADLTRDGLANIGFTVNAYGNNAKFFENVTVKPETEKPNGDGFWLTQDKTYYWPNYQLDFVAWANLGNYATTNVTNDAKEIKLTTPTPVADQVDVIAARNQGTRAANESSGVPMTFKHLLSQVEVWAKNSNTAYTVKVAGIKVGRINSQATFTYPDKLEAGTAIATDQYDGSTPASFGAGSAAEVTLGTDPQTIMNSNNGNFRLIPQALTAWNQTETLADATADNGANYLGVLVNITNAHGAAIYPTTAGQYAFAAVPFSIDAGFEAGKKYIITLDFSEGCGFEDPAITEGKPGDLPTGVTVNHTPVSPDTNKPGRPILGGPIKFTVVVEDYTEVTIGKPMK
ncbi:MAG: fimbrillin family protein [Porphyromonas sp.]|nr:fimbrillin family protein [Porphyromonas sp.]